MKQRLLTPALLSALLFLLAAQPSQSQVTSIPAASTDAPNARWTQTCSLNTGRSDHAATLLQDGRVLVSGGLDPNFDVTASAELYDPATGVWTTTGSMNQARLDHTQTLLANGKVLVAGSSDPSGDGSAGLYDPATGAWSITGMDAQRKNLRLVFRRPVPHTSVHRSFEFAYITARCWQSSSPATSRSESRVSSSKTLHRMVAVRLVISDRF